MNSAQITALGLLAASTADYQTAWRASTRKHSEGTDAYPQADEQMHTAFQSQRVARDTLIDEGFDPQTVHAIEAALTIAAARVEGERDHYFEREDVTIPRGPVVDTVKFIRQTIRGGGIV